MPWVTGSRRRPGSMRRWAVLRRLPVSSCYELLGLADDDMMVISDADEVMSRRTARVLAEIKINIISA